MTKKTIYTWKALTATTRSPIIELRVEDFPTPPFPITRIVNVFTSYEKNYKQHYSIWAQVTIVYIVKNDKITQPGNKKLIHNELPISWIREGGGGGGRGGDWTWFFNFPNKLTNFSWVAAGNCWNEVHSLSNCVAIYCCLTKKWKRLF